MEIKVITVKGEEEPTVVNLKLKAGEPELVISAITISTMHISLLCKAPWVVGREIPHNLNSFIVFSHIVCVDEVGGRANSERRRGRWRLEVNDGVHWRAAIDGRGAGGEVGGSALR